MRQKQMDLISIDDPADPRLADFARLTDVPWRSSIEPQRQIFIAEGAKVIARALACGYRLRCLVAEPKWWPQLQPLLHGQPDAAPEQNPALPDPALFVAQPQVLQQVTGYGVHRGALAAFERKPLPSLADLLASTQRIAVLEDLNDHTNLGAIFRSAAALGIQALVLSPRCADPLYRRSIKVSMGAVLALPYTVVETTAAPKTSTRHGSNGPWAQALEQIGAAGFRLLALTPDDAATPLHQLLLDASDKCALLLGAEGPGLSPHTLQRCEPVRIPMPRHQEADGGPSNIAADEGGPATNESGGASEPVVDSLNVAAAAAIAFYAIGTPAPAPAAAAAPATT